MKIRIRELFNKVLFFNKPEENVVKLKITEEAKYLSIPVNTDVFINDFFNSVPTISSISPTSGVVAGGTSITITGTNLTGTSSVTVGGVAATSVVVVSATSVTAVTPAGTAGVKNIVLITPGGTTTKTNAFTYIGVPTITTINPNTGILAGGTSFTITGTNLTGTSSVTVGGVAATSFTVVSATSITCISPAGTVGPKTITVITPGGSVSLSNAFEYTNISLFPTIISINPTSGVLAGGTSFTITGTNLTGTSSVTVGGVAATSFTVVSATSITVVTPAGATIGLKNITLTTPVGTATSVNVFTYIGIPTISAISPTSGVAAGGTSFTITGTNLTGTSSVTVGGVAATSVVVVSATSVTAVTPAGTAGSQTITLTTPGGTATASSVFTYIAVPTISAISPNTGILVGGTTITITGTNLTATSSVTVGGVAATSFTVVSASSVTAVTPAGTAGVKNITLTTPGGTATASSTFTYFGVPTISAISPNTGILVGGTTITITGTNLTATSSVTVGGVAATSFTVVSASSVTAVTPAGTAGVKNITLTTPGGTATASSTFTYFDIPTISAISPTFGIAAGGTTITITGTNLTATSSVTVGGVAATSFTVVSATSVTAVTPAGTGLKDVVLTTPGGTATASSTFTYFDIPTITTINPNTGILAGGTPITIGGTNLSNTSSVTVGGVAANSFTNVSSTSITAVTPAGTAGVKDVVLTTPGGTVTFSNAFEYTNITIIPTITTIAPTSGVLAGGTSFTITGTNLTGTSSVTVGGVAATSFTVVSATSITVVTPAGATIGLKNITLTTPVGTATSVNVFTYIGIPTITSIAPISGVLAGGTTFGITGTNLTGTSSVTVGGVAATSLTNVSSVFVTAVTPAGATTGAKNIVLTTPGGITTALNAFTYTDFNLDFARIQVLADTRISDLWVLDTTKAKPVGVVAGKFYALLDRSQGGYTSAPNGRLTKWTQPLFYTPRSMADVIKGTTAISGLCASLTYNKFGILKNLNYFYGGQTSGSEGSLNMSRLLRLKEGITGGKNVIKRPYSFNDIKTFGLSAGHTLFGNIKSDKTVTAVAIAYNNSNVNAWFLKRNMLLSSLSQIDEWQSYKVLNYLTPLALSWRFQKEIRQNSIGFSNNVSQISESELNAVNTDTLNHLKILLDEYKDHYPLARSHNGVNDTLGSDQTWRGEATFGYPMGLCGSFGVRTSPYPLGATLDFIPALGISADTWSPQGWTADTGMYLFDGWGMRYLLENMIYLDGVTSVIEPVTTTTQLKADSSWNNILIEVKKLMLKEIFDYVIHTEEGRAWYAKRKYHPDGSVRDSLIYADSDPNRIWTQQATGLTGIKYYYNHMFNGTGYWYPEPDNKGYVATNQNVTPMAYRMLATMYLYPYMTLDKERTALLSAYNMMAEECASVLERFLIGVTSSQENIAGYWAEGWGYAAQSMPDFLKILTSMKTMGDRRLWDKKSTPDYFNKTIPGISYSSWTNNTWKWIVSRIMPNNLIINSGSCNSSGWETIDNSYQFVPWGIYLTAVNASESPAPGTTGSAISELHDWFDNNGGYEEEMEYFYNVRKYQERNTYNEKINTPWFYSPGDCIVTWKSEHVIPKFQSDWTFGSNVNRPDGKPGYVVTNFNKPLVFGLWAKGVGVSDEKTNIDCGHISAYLGDAALLIEAGEPRQLQEFDNNKTNNYFYERETFRVKGHNVMQLGERLDHKNPKYAPWTGVTFTATGGSAFLNATSNYNVRPLKISTPQPLGSNRPNPNDGGFGTWAENDPAWDNVSDGFLYLAGTTQIANTRGGDTAQYLAQSSNILGGTETIDGRAGQYVFEPYQYQIKTCTRGITWEYSTGVAKIRIQDIVGISAFNNNPSFWTATGPYATGPDTRVYYRFHTGYTGANDIAGNPSSTSWPFFTTLDAGLTFFSVSGTNNKTWQAAWTQPIPYNTMAYDGVISRLDSVGVTMTFIGSQPIRLTKELSVNHSFKYSSVTQPGIGIIAPSRHYAINILLGTSGGAGVFHDEKNLTLNTTIDASVKKRDNFTILYQDNITVQQENKLNALGAKKYYLTSRGLSAGWNLSQSNIDAAVTYLKGDLNEQESTTFGRGLTSTSKSFIFLDYESEYNPMTKTGGPTVDVMLVSGHTGPNGFTGPDDPTFDQTLLDGRIFGQTCANKYFYEWIEGGTSNNGTTFHGLRHYFPGCSFGNYGPHWWWGSSEWFGKTDTQIDTQLEIAANTLVAGCSAALKAFDIFSPSVYSNVNNAKHSRWNAAQNVRLYKKINAKMGTNKPIMPWLTPMYWHNGTGTPYTTSNAPDGYTGFEAQYTPPFTFLLDSDIVYENAEPLIAEGADGVLIWNSPEYRSIQIIGRPSCSDCSEFNLIGFEGRTAQAADRKYQQWPSDKPTTPGASPAGQTLNEWSFFTANRQAISAHENYIKGRDMGITGNRWWWKEISGSTAYTPPEWGNLNTNLQWNDPNITTGTTGAEIITRTYRDTFYNMAKVIKQSYGTKDQWISGMIGPINGLTGNRRVNGVQQ